MDAAGLSLTLVDLSCKIIRYLQNIKHGGDARRELLSEIFILWLLLQNLQLQCETWERSPEASRDQSLSALFTANGVLHQMREQLEELSRRLTRRTSATGKMMAIVLWPFQEDETRRILHRVHDLTTKATHFVSQSSYGILQSIQNNTETIASDTEIIKNDTEIARDMLAASYLEKLFSWLSPLRSIETQREVLGDADPNTWVLDSKEFRLWQDDDQIRTLWCHGAPGAGKSVLLSSVYERLQKLHRSQKVAVLVAFCSFDSDESKTPRGIVGDLLLQALQLRVDGSIPTKLKEAHQNATTGRDGQKSTLNSLEEILRNELESLDGAFILLDGLDEAGDAFRRADVIDAIHAYGPRVKVMITSRRLDDIPETLENPQACDTCGLRNPTGLWSRVEQPKHVICEVCRGSEPYEERAAYAPVGKRRWIKMEFHPREHEIQSYISKRLGKGRNLGRILQSSPSNEQLEDKVITRVVEKSEKLYVPSLGTTRILVNIEAYLVTRFLLARLHIDSLDDSMNGSDIRQTLEDLSGDLDQTYDQALTRMENTLRPKHWNILQKILLWAAWVEEPLTTYALEHALAVKPGMSSITSSDILPVQEVVTWSGGVLFIDHQNLVRFIHPTTGRYFLQRRQARWEDGDHIIAEACLSYLAMDAFMMPSNAHSEKRLFSSLKRENPFLEYVVLHSSRHIDRSGSREDTSKTVRLLKSDSLHFLVEGLYYLDAGWHVEKGATALHIASHMNLTEVAFEIVQSEGNVNARDDLGTTALMYVASNGRDNAKLFDMLLSVGAEPSLQCNHGSTALIRAVKSKSKAIMARLLREPNININAVSTDPTGRGETALLVALQKRQKAAFETLLTRPDANPNLSSRKAPSPLYYSCEHGILWGVAALVSRDDTDIEIKDAIKQMTPLMRALLSGFRKGFGMLRSKGARLDCRDSQQGTLLMRAADRNASAVWLKDLLHPDADVNAVDVHGRNALHSAAVNDSITSLKFLLDNTDGIQVNLQDELGRTPLHDACRSMNLDGVKALVAAGARSDLKTKFGLTAMDIAKQRGRDDIMDFLKESTGQEGSIDIYQQNPLMFAIRMDASEALQTRIRSLSVEEVNKTTQEWTPLSIACAKGRADVVGMLLEAGASPNPSGLVRFPLREAINGGSLDCFRLLMVQNANIHGIPGTASLWEYAWEKKQFEMACILLEKGALISRESPYLQEALLWATQGKRLALIKRLLREGASMDQKAPGHPYTAERLAEIRNLDEVLTLMAEQRSINSAKSNVHDSHG